MKTGTWTTPERAIGTFIGKVYNGQRLHSALAYLAPAEFEATMTTGSVQAPDGAIITQL